VSDRHPPINPKVPRFLHGGDYNPDQWPPEVWQEDMRLMKLAGCNAMSVAIFSWAHLEPEDGRYTFDWLDRVMDLLAEHGAFAVLATPSASHPAWLSTKYPEVLRVGADRRRRAHGGRVNYCLTSPVFREKCAAMAKRLAERYRSHPALLLWHASNEYGGDCHCELCQAAFRDWLQRRYESLDALNRAWWTAFWGHTYGDWQQIASPGPAGMGESSIHGLALDWKRFVTDQTVSFLCNETEPLRRITPDVPVTTNMMGTYTGLNYWRFAEHVDRVSWDSYPQYHDRDGDWRKAVGVSFVHDLYRTMKSGRPFLLMESTPSSTNWMPVMKLKRPGVHRLASLQAVAHGSDTVQYFQWRKGRGCAEKFHGAVVDHCGHEHTRVFREVAEVAQALAKLDGVIGTTVRPEVAVVYDWENRWAIDGAAGPRREARDYEPTCVSHYRQFWHRAVPVDVIDMDGDFARYKLLVAPMLYMVRPGVAERLERFVADGGTFVTTYWTGIADESDLVFTGGFPGPLRKLLGIWSEEIDVLHDDESNRVAACEDNSLHLAGEYRAETFCDLIHAEAAEVLATYRREFYAGRPALTVNAFGKGRAFYIASRNEEAFLRDFYGRLIDELRLERVLASDLPEGVTAQLRTDGQRRFVFLLNFRREPAEVDLAGAAFTDTLTGEDVRGAVALRGYGSMVLERR
jgi:beta-galactosidase